MGQKEGAPLRPMSNGRLNVCPSFSPFAQPTNEKNASINGHWGDLAISAGDAFPHLLHGVVGKLSQFTATME